MNKVSFSDSTLLIPLCSWLGLVAFSGFPPPSSSEQDNEAPKVSILAPEKGGSYPPNSRVPYKISVSDREDGESKYDEIAPGEVLLEIRYVPGADNTEAAGAVNSVTDKGLLGIAASNCLYCHAFRGNLIGPSFQEIGSKYQQTRQGMEEIAERIINGSTGIWGDKVMPSHPELDTNEVKEMLRWITTYATRADLQYQNGLEGTIELRTGPTPGQGEGTFILRAAYRDHGTGEAPGKTGTDQLILRTKQ